PGAGGSTTSERSTQGSPTPPSNQVGAPAADSAKAATTAAPTGAGLSATVPGTPQDAAARADQGAQREVSKAVPGPVGPSPLMWLPPPPAPLAAPPPPQRRRACVRR